MKQEAREKCSTGVLSHGPLQFLTKCAHIVCVTSDVHQMLCVPQDEIEIVLQVNSTSYVAVGWRPIGKPSFCPTCNTT